MRQSIIHHEYTVLFEPTEEGGYNVVVPSIPEICTFGSTFAEAKDMAADAIRCYLESARALGEEAPADIGLTQKPRTERIAVKMAAL